jgi:hypothetical protein
MTTAFGRFLRQNAIALLALFLVLGGTSYAAASLINGRSIKPHTIPKNRLTNSAIAQLRGARGPQGPQGLQGPPGPQGPQGPQGPPGTSLFDSVIPSGTTVHGAWGIGEQQVGTGGSGSLYQQVSLPIPAPQRLTFDIVNFAAGTPGAEDGDASCTGSVGNPTAPPGKVCLYITDFNSTTGEGGYQISNNDDAQRYGFTVAMRGTTTFIDGRGTWAYHAP